MKVLQVNILYNQGSTGKIVADIHSFLCDNDIRSIVCYGTGAKVQDTNIYKISYHHELSFYRIWAHIMGLQYASGYLSTLRLIKMIKKEKPDIVHLHCINGFFINIYKLIAFLKKTGIGTVLTLHAEFMYTGSCGYSFDCNKWKIGCGDCPQPWDATYSYFIDRTKTAWKKMWKAFQGFDNIIIACVSPWVQERAKQAPILAGKEIITIENGVDTVNIFHPVPFNELKDTLGIKNEKIILHVTAKFSTSEENIKGGRFIYQLADYLKEENVKIVIVGCDSKNVKMGNNIINIGKVMDQKRLAQYYSMADLTVITSKKETFSMPCVESLVCGTPVVGFKAGGPETICLIEHSEFVEYGDINALVNCVKKWLHFKTQQKSDICFIKEHYSKEIMGKKYQQAYEVLIRKSSNHKI